MIVKYISHSWINRRGNECYVKLTFNRNQWFLPLGLDWRGSTSRSISIGILCLRFHYSEYKYGLTPYTQSIERKNNEVSNRSTTGRNSQVLF